MKLLKLSAFPLLLLLLAHIGLVACEVDDYYGDPCQTALAKFNYGCTSDNKTAALECRCTNDIFLKSAVYCVDSHTDNEEARTVGYQAVVKPCKSFIKIKALTKIAKNLDPSEFQTVNNTKDIKKQELKKPIILPASYLKPYFAAKAGKVNSPYIANKLGGGFLAYWALVLLLRSISNLTSKFFPSVLRALDTKAIRKFRKKVILPPTFNYKHSTTHKIFGVYSFAIPVRFQTLILIGFFIVRFVLYFTNYPVSMPNYITPTVAKQITSFLASRAGIFALSQLPLLLLFGGRNNLLIWITGWPLDTFNVFHRWLGRSVMFDLIIHGTSYTASSINIGKLYSRWHQAWWHWGLVAALCNGFLIIQAAHAFRAHRYETFLVIHLVLAFIFVMGAWYHLKLLEDERQYSYAAVAVWAFDRLVRVIRLIVSGLNSRAETQLFPDGIIKMKISYSRLWKIKPGAYGFFHILKPSFFWQSHPFTIIRSPLEEDKDKLVIIMRVKDGMTKKIQQSLEQLPTRTSNIPVWIEGPYGSNNHVEHYDNVVMVAGGIGITGVYSYACGLRDNTDPNKRFLFMWCIASEQPLAWFSQELEYLASDKRFDVRVFINGDRPTEPIAEIGDDDSSSVSLEYGESVEKEKPMRPAPMARVGSTSVAKCYERVSIKSAVYDEILNANGSSAFVCCGPNSMNDDVRVTIAKHLEAAKGRVDYFEESFSW